MLFLRCILDQNRLRIAVPGFLAVDEGAVLIPAHIIAGGGVVRTEMTAAAFLAPSSRLYDHMGYGEHVDGFQIGQ